MDVLMCNMRGNDRPDEEEIIEAVDRLGELTAVAVNKVVGLLVR
jgi:hypothetical protein